MYSVSGRRLCTTNGLDNTVDSLTNSFVTNSVNVKQKVCKLKCICSVGKSPCHHLRFKIFHLFQTRWMPFWSPNRQCRSTQETQSIDIKQRKLSASIILSSTTTRQKQRGNGPEMPKARRPECRTRSETELELRFRLRFSIRVSRVRF